MKWTDISEEGNGYDWECNYQPEIEGDPANAGSSEDTSHLDYNFKENFYLKKTDITMWFNWESTTNFWTSYSIGFRCGNTSFNVPNTLPDGTSRNGLIRQHDNKIQFKTDAVEDKLEIWINNVYHGSMKLSDTGLNIGEKASFGIHRSAITSNNYEVTKIVIYKANINTTTSLEQITAGTHFETNEKIEYKLTLLSEYGLPIPNERIRLYCNEDDVSFDVDYGGVSVETGTKYYNLTTDNNGNGKFRLMNITNTATKYDVQVHKQKDYLYNYSISSSIRAWYRTQPIIDANSVVDSTTYSDNKKLYLNAILKDNKGNEIQDVDFGKIYINGVQNQIWDNTKNNYISLNIPNGAKDEYTLSVKWKYEESDLYHSAEITKNITVILPKDDMAFDIIDDGSTTYPNQSNIKLNLIKLTDYKSDNVKSKTIKIYKNNTLFATKTTDNNGSISFSDYLDAGTQNYIIKFEGNASLNSTQYTLPVFIEKGEVDFTCIENNSPVYLGQNIVFKLKLLDAKGTPISNYTIHSTVEFDDYSKSYSAKTNTNGIATFTIPSPDSTESSLAYTTNTWFNTDNNHFSKELDNIFLEWKKKDEASLKIQSLGVSYPHEAKITGTLKDTNTGNIIENAEIKCYIDGEFISSGLTDSAGKVIFTNTKPPKKRPSTFEYKLVFEGNDKYGAVTSTMEGIYYRNQTKIIETSNTNEVCATEENEITVQLLSNENSPLKTSTLKYIATNTDNDGNTNSTEGTLKTDSNGYVTLKLTSNVRSNTEIIWNYVGSQYYDVCSITTSFSWKKMPTHIILNSTTGNKEVTKQGKITIVLYDKNNNLLISVPINKTITFVTTDNKPVTLESYAPKTTLTGSGGESVIQYTPTKLGDIVGTFKWEFEGNETYDSTSFSQKITWRKIETKLTAKNVTHYNGRYTNIQEEEPVWNKESPGVKEDYTNFSAILETDNTETSYTKLNNETILFKSTYGNTLFSTTTNNNGEGKGRWTRTFQDSDLANGSRTSTIVVEFEGSNLFKPSTVNMTIKTLKRIEPKIDINYILVDGYGDNIFYNIPFNITATLTENNEPMSNQTLIFNVNNNEGYSNAPWSLTTNANGIAALARYRPKVVGELPVLIEFDKEDKIDKYLPISYEKKLNVNKDQPILQINPAKSKYTSCEEGIVNVKLTNSISEPLSGKIHIKYDDGTYNSAKWIAITNDYVTTDTNGNTSFNMESYSGIRLLQGIFDETWCYKKATSINHIEYDLTKTYTQNVTDGIVEIPIECALNSTKGIPEGLYDVKIEYIPPTTESGNCTLYGATQKTQPIRKKKGVKLEIISDEFEKPVYEPLFVSVKASDYKNNKMIGYEITSYINDTYRSYPNHISDSNGGVSRGFASLVIGSENKYSFIFNQTREYAGCRIDVDTTTLKRKPTLEIPASISGYTSLPIEMKATHYFFHDTYNRYGQIVKKDSSGNFVYHNPLAKNSTAYNEYYYVKNDAEIKCDKTYYDNAEPNSSKIWIQNKKIIWKNKDKTKTLTSAPTMNNGVSTALYTSNTAMNEKVYAISEEDNTYLSCEAQSNLNVIQRTEAWFADINFDEKDSNGRYVRHGVYNQEYILFTYLYLDKNKHVEEGETVIFKQGNAKIGEGTTDSNGRTILTIKCTTPTLYPYTVEFKGHDQYTDATKSYKVHIEKQTPLLTLNISNTNPNVGDKITLKATFTESEAAGKKPLKSTGLLFKDGDENILWQRTDDKGVATITYVTKHGGQRTFYVGYEDENNVRYNKVSKTQQITIKKIATSIECKEGNPYEIPGDSTYKLTFTLKDSNKNTLIGKKITVNYNGTSKEYTTNNYGQVSVDSGTYVQGTTKNMVLSFGGDDNYASSTLTENLTWGQPLNREDCSNLDNFDIIYENWYASDGSSKWGLDVEGLNLLDGQAANNNDKYKNQCTPILGTNYKLRTVCNKLVTTRSELEDLFDKENKIVAPTGVAVRSKRIKTTNKCTIKFYFKINYDKSNEPYNGGASNYLMAGHFGLLEGGNLNTAEKAPVRLEFYRGNAYMISEGGKAMYSNLRYKLFLPSTEYLVDLDVDGNKITVTFYNGKNERVSEPQTWTMSKSLENLHPYAFAYTNGTALVLREIEIIKK